MLSLQSSYHLPCGWWCSDFGMGNGFSGELSSISGEYGGKLLSSEVLEVLNIPFQGLTQCLVLCRSSLNAQEMSVWMSEQWNVWPFMMLLSQTFFTHMVPKCLLGKSTQMKEKCVSLKEKLPICSYKGAVRCRVIRKRLSDITYSRRTVH